MEEQRKKRKDADQDDGPEEEEVKYKFQGKILTFNLSTSRRRIFLIGQRNFQN